MAYVNPTHWVKNLGAAKTGRMVALPPANVGAVPIVHKDAITVDAAQNDTIGLFEVSTSAHLLRAISFIAFTALGASVVADVGFANDAALGVASKTAVLGTDIAMTNAGTSVLLEHLGAVDFDQPIWKLLGLASDPKGTLLVILTLKGANPASGTIYFEQGVLPT